MIYTSVEAVRGRGLPHPLQPTALELAREKVIEHLRSLEVSGTCELIIYRRLNISCSCEI